jgi:hypothetical protein
MTVLSRHVGATLGLILLASAGCASPYRSDQGALLGGLGGAGVGALVGDAVGNPLAGAAIGAGVGAVSGAVIGDSLDQIEAQNRAEIEARLGRQVAAGAVTVPDVVAMTEAGVDDELIVNHVRIHGAAQALQTGDIIYLKNNGVSARVIQAMQQPPAPQTIVREVPPPPVIVEHYYDDPWCYHPHYHYYHRRHHHPHVSWGLSFGHHH